MSNKMLLVAGVVLMVAVIVSVDVLFFRAHFWERLIANVAVVAIFASLYMRYFN